MDRTRTRIVEVELPSGAVVPVEIAATGPSDVSSWQRLKLDDAESKIIEIAGWLFETVEKAIPRQPDTIGLDFGIKLAAKSGKLTSVLAEVSGEAAVTIRLEWSPKGREDRGDPR